MEQKSIAKQVFDWLKEKPYIQSTLKQGLINYSTLSRVIQKELDIKNFDAVIVALRRYKKENVMPYTGKDIIKLLKESRLEIKTGINVYVVKPEVVKYIEKSKYLHLVQGKSAATVISEDKLDIEYIKKQENLLEVRILSSPTIENNLGFMAYVCSALTENGIVILETYSCYTDTIFIFKKEDLTRVVETLESIGIK